MPVHPGALITDYAPIGGKAHFSFGVDRPFAGYALEWFKYVNAADADKEKPFSDWQSRERLGQASFPLAAKTPQLQAADFLVHLTYLEMDKWLKTGVKPIRPPKMLRACLTNMRTPYDHVYQDKKSLQVVIDKAAKLAPLWKH